MGKDKPTLTLSFNNKTEDAAAFRARMLERINQARGNIIVPSKEELAKKIAATDAAASTKVTTKNLKAKPAKSAKDVNKDKQEINQVKAKAQGTPLTKNQKTKSPATKSQTSKDDEKKTKKSEPETNTEKNKDNNQDKLSTAKTTNTKPAKSNSKLHTPKKVIAEKKHKVDPALTRRLDKYYRETFPLCFTDPIAPLALGIHHQLREYKIEHPESLCSNSYIYKFLYVYTKHIQYKKALVAGAPRLNIDGTIGGVVTEEEAKQATEDLERFEQAKQAKLAKKIEQYKNYKERKNVTNDENAPQVKHEELSKEDEIIDITDAVSSLNIINNETSGNEVKIKKTRKPKKD